SVGPAAGEADVDRLHGDPEIDQLTGAGPTRWCGESGSGGREARGGGGDEAGLQHSSAGRMVHRHGQPFVGRLRSNPSLRPIAEKVHVWAGISQACSSDYPGSQPSRAAYAGDRLRSVAAPGTVSRDIPVWST